MDRPVHTDSATVLGGYARNRYDGFSNLEASLMIRSVRIRNYKCLRDTTVTFREPLTAVIGPNNSGKSCFQEALRVLLLLGESRLASLFQGGLTGFFFVRTHGVNEPISFQICLDAQDEQQCTFEYEISFLGEQPSGWIRVVSERLVERRGANEQILLELNPARSNWRFYDSQTKQFQELNGDPGVQGIQQLFDKKTHSGVFRFRSLLGNAWFFNFQPEAMKSAAPVGPQPVLRSDGANLAAVLDFLNSETAEFSALLRDLKSFVPEVRGLPLKTIEGGQKFLAFQESYSGVDVPSFAVSDGLLRLVAYLSVLHDPRKCRFMAFEEPENGVHSRRLSQMVDCMRAAVQTSTAETGRQILLTTHSAYLLDKLRPEEVLVAARDKDGTKIEPIKDMDTVKKLLEDAPLGELWYRGSIGGVPNP
jgi:predicted ATPase